MPQLVSDHCLDFILGKPRQQRVPEHDRLVLPSPVNMAFGFSLCRLMSIS